MRRHLHVRAAFFFLAACGLALRARADILHVPADYSTIQACIDAAVSGQDECVVAPGTYNELINFLGKAITLRSTHGPEVTTIDGTGLRSSVISCISIEGPDTVLSGFAVTGGSGSGDPRLGGGLLISGGAPSITDCIFVSNTADYGGAVFSNSDGKLQPTIVRCEFRLNTAYHGGGMHNRSVHMGLTDCTFSENLAYRGGAIYNETLCSGFENRSPTINRCKFANNRAIWNGGAIYNYEGGCPTIIDSSFLNNTATNGGGIFNFSASPFMSRCVLQGNTASDAGGAMRNLGHSTPEISFCSFERNTANSGGGMHNEMESHPFIDRCSFFRNTAATQGGGLYSMNGATFVFRSSFHGNRADQGGAVYDDKPRTRLSILNSTFVGNRANVGGAVHLDTQGGHGYIDNCTFARNSSIRGGAIYNRDYAVYLENCILWGDEPEDIATEQTAGGSMSFSDMMGDWPPRLNDDGGNIDIDPIFVREPHDGGDGWGDDTNTPDFDESLNDDFGDLRLQPGSPCINAGNPDYVAGPGETDLDGHGRMLCGRVDIGAYEFGIGDFDCDYVVDIEDLAGWEGCESDPSALPTLWFLPWSPPAPFLEDGVGDCEAFDFEYDGDVDLMDFAAWQNILGN